MSHGKITHLDLFSGIGGFALAADRVFGNVEHVFCDNEPFAQEVLRRHWPDAPIFGDIRELNAETYRHRCARHRAQRIRGPTIDLLTGGFPCQPFSQAGRRRGAADDRFLWPEMCRVIGEFEPRWVIAENVRGLLTQDRGVVFERVCADLEALGYHVIPLIIPAVAVGAPHRRDRIWFIANRACNGPRRSKPLEAGRSTRRLEQFCRDAADASSTRLQGCGQNGRDNVDSLIERGVTKGQHGTRTGLKLQPAFAEWMMGYPEGWTELPGSKLSAMRSFPRLRSGS